METERTDEATAEQAAQEIRALIDAAVARRGGDTAAVKPGHRVPFAWPPEAVSHRYPLHSSDWRGTAEFRAHGETFPVQTATTPYGVFGRCEPLWLEAKGDTLEAMLKRMKESAEPLFRRQRAISEALGAEGRFTGSIRSLDNLSLLKLLYCTDRDVSHEASKEIELRASQFRFLPALLEVLADRRHPHRRAAQWCVLDLFEDFPSFCRTSEDEAQVVATIRDLIWSAEDDYARTIYKAGVVLGGHLPGEIGGPALIECLRCVSKVGRRSAIHGLFHVVEWDPELRGAVVRALEECADVESDPQLKEYAQLMASDITQGAYDHIPEPVFPEELSP